MPAVPRRSGEYVQVLDKYLSRLAALNRPLDALRVYRTEIDRNPNDPGLYERLAAFLEQNGMSREVEEIYTKAIAKFADRSWYHKLARWYLRQRAVRARSRRSAAMPSPYFPAPNLKRTSAKSSRKPAPMPFSTAN